MRAACQPFSLILVVAVVFLAGPAWATDTDGDGVSDDVDNCTNVLNANQRDTDNDGYGNACDPDFNEDLVVNFSDLATAKQVFFQQGSASTAADNADLDGNGIVNFADLARMKSLFFQPPGRSAYAAAEIYAVTPTESVVVAGADLYVMGRRFDQGTMSAKLIDPARPLADLPTPIAAVDSPNILHVFIPSFTPGNVGERTRYTLNVYQDMGSGRKLAHPKLPDDDHTPGKQTDFYLRTIGGEPANEDVNVHLVGIRANVLVIPDNYVCHPPFDPPYCKPGLVLWAPPAYNFAGFDDSWNSADWSTVRPYYDQGSRDWGTVCGRVWAPNVPVGIRGLAEVVPRKTIIWPPLHAFPVYDSDLMSPFAAGQLKWWGPNDPQTQDKSPNTQYLVGSPPLSACAWFINDPFCANFQGARTDAITVVNVYKILDADGNEVDPNTDFRGRWTPEYGNGFVVVTNNPCLNCRADIPVGQSAPLPVNVPTSYSPPGIAQATPNWLLHETMHAFGYLDELVAGRVTISAPYGTPETGFTNTPLLWRGYSFGPPSQEYQCNHVTAPGGYVR